MPLHDWSEAQGWDSVHLLWVSELVRWLRPRLPTGYRAFPGAVPVLTIDAGGGARPDVYVRDWRPDERPDEAADAFAPDFESVALFETEPVMAVHVERQGALAAAIEIVSLRNKDRPNERQDTVARYVGYLRRRVHLMVVDCLPHRRDFSFADAVAASVGFPAPPCPAPCAASYRVGGWLRDAGTRLACRQSHLEVGRALPTLPLALGAGLSVDVDLESTYSAAARDAYVDELRG